MMDVQVKTRWDADGLVQISCDAETAHVLRQVVYNARRTAPGLDKLADSLAHTLGYPKEEKP